jgi:hypothetical protein
VAGGLAGDAVKLARWYGAVIWVAGLTIRLWAPHKPLLVTFPAVVVLSVVATVLLFWPWK